MTMVRGLRIHDRIARSVYDGESMHIVIATVGTRGDAQPYVALGKVLSARGHRVTLATHERITASSRSPTASGFVPSAAPIRG